MTTTFSKCSFVPTEINHDLNPPISMTRNQNLDFQETSRTNLNTGEHGCSEPTTIEFLNDEQIVNKIFQTSLNQLKSLSNNVEIPIEVLVETLENNNRISNKMNVQLKKYNKPYGVSLFGIFSDYEDVFFIIDTGDNLVQTLKGLTPQGEKSININVIHSMLTLADSAPKTLPDSKNYKSLSDKVKLYSYYYTQAIEVPPNDPLFMSSYRIINAMREIGWKIQQRWNINNKGTEHTDYQTFDAKKDNSKPVVKSYLSNHLEELDADRRNASLYMQKKRSGDYLQIWIAKQFPGLAATRRDNFIYVRGPDENKGSFRKSNDENWYKERTYFVTGDWPAFSYSVYNKVNSIMIFKHPKELTKSCIIRIHF